MWVAWNLQCIFRGSDTQKSTLVYGWTQMLILYSIIFNKSRLWGVLKISKFIMSFDFL